MEKIWGDGTQKNSGWGHPSKNGGSLDKTLEGGSTTFPILPPP